MSLATIAKIQLFLKLKKRRFQVLVVMEFPPTVFLGGTS